MSKAKILLIILGAALLTIAALVVYRLFFQFSNASVQSYISAEAAKYGDPTTASKIISDGCQFILSEYKLTKQVLDYASAQNLPKEQVLVTAALKDAISRGYLDAA